MSQLVFQHQFKLSYGNLKSIRKVLADKANILNLSPELTQNIKLVCNEYCTNLLDHQAEIASSITISYERSGHEHYLRIKDNGSAWELLSQKLEAAELPSCEVENGMGLALIRATFPDFDYQRHSQHNQIRFRLPKQNQRRQILIVDDSSSQLALLASFLEQDYQLALFSQASEALLWLANNHCDLVLTDLHMPEINGFDFRNEVARIEHHQMLPFVFLSGDTMNNTLSTAAQSGIDDFLAKPITQPHLLSVLDRVIERHSNLSSCFEAKLKQQITTDSSHTLVQAIPAPLQLTINQHPQVGGDFVMQQKLKDGSQLIILGDQMGHGLAAKINGSVCFGFINGLLCSADISPQQLCTSLNSYLYQASETTSLICLIVLHLAKDNILTVYNAGMPNPILFANHAIEIEAGMGLLGLFKTIEVTGWQVQLSAGDSLHCYSDGLNEGLWSQEQLNKIQSLPPRLRHKYLWNRSRQTPADDCSIVTILHNTHEDAKRPS